ncbi:hypothetical protein HZB03_03510 [Candidatus Woesearchaeota archaeon]|nr:hypothetical protein [Candidatus Woesearchaeota archaeon]
MKINELQPRQGKVELAATVLDIGQSRTFDKGGNQGRVANATIKDETGSIKLSLWNEQIDQVHVGDLIKIANGYVSEFRGEMQLSTGKFGKLEVVNAGEAAEGAQAATVSGTPEASSAHPTVPSALPRKHSPSSGEDPGRFSEPENDDDEDPGREEESDFSVEEEDVV